MPQSVTSRNTWSAAKVGACGECSIFHYAIALRARSSVQMPSARSATQVSYNSCDAPKPLNPHGIVLASILDTHVFHRFLLPELAR